MAERAFPAIRPSSRTYSPGRQPETVFQSQNGAVSIVAFGGKFVNSILELEFANISDLKASQILRHYESVIENDYVTFRADNAFDGMTLDLTTACGLESDLLRYRYREPPRIQSVFPGVSTVRCVFIGLLRGV